MRHWPMKSLRMRMCLTPSPPSSLCSNEFSLRSLWPPYLKLQPLPNQILVISPWLICFPQCSSLPNKLYNLLLSFIYCLFFLLEHGLSKDKKSVLFMAVFVALEKCLAHCSCLVDICPYQYTVVGGIPSLFETKRSFFIPISSRWQSYFHL